MPKQDIPKRNINQQRKIMIENIVQDKSSHTRHVFISLSLYNLLKEYFWKLKLNNSNMENVCGKLVQME